MEDQSHIACSTNGGTAFVGLGAVKLFRAITLKHALGMYDKFKMIPTRGLTIPKLLALAKEFTGKDYKRGEAAKAMADVSVWVETMKSAMPITVDGELL